MFCHLFNLRSMECVHDISVTEDMFKDTISLDD